MARQVRLEDEIAAFVADSGPEEDSLTSKANRLLRQMRDDSLDVPRDRAVSRVLPDLDPPHEIEVIEPEPVASPEVAVPRVRARPARARSRAAAALPAAPAGEIDLTRFRTPPLRLAKEKPLPRNTAGDCPHPLLLRSGGRCGKCGEPVA